MLDLYSDYLLSSFGATAAPALSALLDGPISHDPITRFLARADCTSKELWHQVKPPVRSMEREEGLLFLTTPFKQNRIRTKVELPCFDGQWDVQGIDPRTVQRWMGHRDLTTTLRYAHVSPDHEWGNSASSVSSRSLYGHQLRDGIREGTYAEASSFVVSASLPTR
ncbi:MAG: hypothetical protein GKR89_37595 [Candidatus Latescibacteria bacterium]|nr:hypothetical protein [Candidatus Latescibacterota bacterium]